MIDRPKARQRRIYLAGANMARFPSDRRDAGVPDQVVEAVMAVEDDAGIDLADLEQGITGYESVHFNAR